MGFYPSGNGWGTPGIVYVGAEEGYAGQNNKQVLAVYDVSETDATSILVSAHNYYDQSVIYNPISPGGDVCWNFTDYIRNLSETFGYINISDTYFPAILYPDELTYQNIDNYIQRFEE